MFKKLKLSSDVEGVEIRTSFISGVMTARTLCIPLCVRFVLRFPQDFM